MPQIVFEHSSNLTGIDYKNLFLEIHHSMAKIPNIGTCKIRAASQDNYYIGTDNGENAFAYLRVSMASREDRSDEFRENIAKDLIPILTRYLNPVKQKLNIKCYPTVEIAVLSKQYYWIEDKEAT